MILPCSRTKALSQSTMQCSSLNLLFWVILEQSYKVFSHKPSTYLRWTNYTIPFFFLWKWSLLTMNTAKVSDNEVSICRRNPCVSKAQASCYSKYSFRHFIFTFGAFLMSVWSSVSTLTSQAMRIEAPPICCSCFLYEGQPIRGKLA